MLFNSLPFLIFLPIVVAGYYLIPYRFRWLWLLLASCYFYAAFVPAYLFVLGALIVVDYVVAILMEREPRARVKRQLLAVGIISNFGFLFAFKYFNFFTANVAALAHWIGWHYDPFVLTLLLPLGLSFHTFQSVSYLVEVYRGNWKAERHFGIYALFVMFFPQLVAGPIERAAHILPQLHTEHRFSWLNIVSGLELIIWGFFLKVGLADRIALIEQAFYQNPAAHPGLPALMAIAFFAFQLYGDFAGYTAIARGSARMLGIELVINFNRPYLAATVGEFWQRWHISLSSWLRDYVYTSVLKLYHQFSTRAVYTAVMVTFLAAGLWHGAGWTFIAMGAWFGIMIVLELMTRSVRERFAQASGLARYPLLRRIVDVARTFLLVLVGWVFFRAPTIQAAVAAIVAVFRGWTNVSASTLSFGYQSSEILITAALIVFLMAIEVAAECGIELPESGTLRALYVRSSIFAFLAFLILAFGAFDENAFIYFQF